MNPNYDVVNICELYNWRQPIAHAVNRCFCFRDQLQAVYRDGLLTVTAPKANKVSTVTVKVEG